MERFNIEQIATIVKHEFPKEAMELSDSLEIVNIAINDVMEAINAKVTDMYERREFSSSREFTTLAESIYEYEKKIEQLVSLLEIDEEPRSEIGGPEETDEETEMRTIPNYAAYEVDHNIEHTLYENFTHIRPHSFQFRDHQRILVSKWNELLFEVCQLLLDMDEGRFRSFEHDSKMNGKKRKYISADPSKIRKPHRLSEGLYIESNQSANAIRYFIIKMLKAYQINLNDIKIYFRADYSELNRK